MQLQTCVRDPAEAARAVRAGSGGVEVMSAAPEVIRAVVSRVRLLRDDVVIGAGVGPLETPTLAAMGLRIRQVAACGVDRVRVLVPAQPSSVLLLNQLGQLAREGLPVTPVLWVPPDPGDGSGWAQRLGLASRQGFTSVLLDARGVDAQGVSLWQRPVTPARLLGAFDALRRCGAGVGLMAAPRRVDLPLLLRWAPDEVVIDCGRDDRREGRVLDDYQLDQWVAALRSHQAQAQGAHGRSLGLGAPAW